MKPYLFHHQKTVYLLFIELPDKQAPDTLDILKSKAFVKAMLKSPVAICCEQLNYCVKT